MESCLPLTTPCLFLLLFGHKQPKRSYNTFLFIEIVVADACWTMLVFILSVFYYVLEILLFLNWWIPFHDYIHLFYLTCCKSDCKLYPCIFLYFQAFLLTSFVLKGSFILNLSFTFLQENYTSFLLLSVNFCSCNFCVKKLVWLFFGFISRYL